MKLVQNVSKYSGTYNKLYSNTSDTVNFSKKLFECIFKFFIWSRLVDLPSSHEMKVFCTENEFQVDLENLRVQLEISCRFRLLGSWVDLMSVLKQK